MQHRASGLSSFTPVVVLHDPDTNKTFINKKHKEFNSEQFIGMYIFVHLGKMKYLHTNEMGMIANFYIAYKLHSSK